jgi:hypothetical protein
MYKLLKKASCLVLTFIGFLAFGAAAISGYGTAWCLIMAVTQGIFYLIPACGCAIVFCFLILFGKGLGKIADDISRDTSPAFSKLEVHELRNLLLPPGYAKSSWKLGLGLVPVLFILGLIWSSL